MKKLLGIVVLGLLLSSNAYANDLTVNGLLKEGFKIKKDELTKSSNGITMKVITFTKGQEYAICSISINLYSGPGDANCKKP